MSEGVTLRFQRDESGRPLVMFIRDLLASCPVCGREAIERTYDQLPYHALTMGRFRQLVAEAPVQFDSACEQCGEPMGPNEVDRWTVSYGFPIGLGMIQGFGTRDGSDDCVEYALSPYREFDAQMLPQWSAEDDQSVCRSTKVDEADSQRVLGRFLSLKAGWRRCLKSFVENDNRDRAQVALAPGTFGLVARNASAIDSELRALIEREGGASEEQWVWTHLADDINELMDAGPSEWLPDRWYRRLKAGQLWAVGVVDVGAVETALHSALAVLPGPTECEIDGAFDATIRFPMGDEPSFVTELSLKSVAAESIVSGASPSDWIRLWLDDTIGRITEHT